MSHMNSNFMWKIVALGREMLSELSKQCNLLHLYNEYRKGENVTHIYWHCPWWKQQLWPPCTNWQTYLTFHFQLALCIDGKNTTHKPVTWWDHISALLLKLILIACNPSYSRGRELEHHAWLEASPGK
jgi:hypothetical protein